MTGRHQILHTKLHELENILDEALLRGPESHSHEDIKTKLAFIRNLLSAEVASEPTKPHHLLHISNRLVSLEKSFNEWDTQRTFTTEDFEKDNSISSCSCTESCLNDDGDTLENKDSGMTIYDNPLVEDSWNFDDEKAIVESSGNGISEIRERNGKRGIGKNCCAMASGVVIGMILMSFIMVNFSDCFYYYDDEQASFAFPT